MLEAVPALTLGLADKSGCIDRCRFGRDLLDKDLIVCYLHNCIACPECMLTQTLVSLSEFR